jgi:hypothetical protein
MKEDEVGQIVDQALRGVLGPLGYQNVVVRSGADDDGDPALFLDALFAPNASIVRGAKFGEALQVVRRALLRHGETRIPYLLITHPDDEYPEDVPADIRRWHG